MLITCCMSWAAVHTIRTKVIIDRWARAWTSDWIWVIVVDADTEVTSDQTSFSCQHLLHRMSDRMRSARSMNRHDSAHLTEAKLSRDAELSRKFSSLEHLCVGQPFLFVVIIGHVGLLSSDRLVSSRESCHSAQPSAPSLLLPGTRAQTACSSVGDRAVPLFLGNRSRNGYTPLHPQIFLFLSFQVKKKSYHFLWKYKQLEHKNYMVCLKHTTYTIQLVNTIFYWQYLRLRLGVNPTILGFSLIRWMNVH